MSPFETLHPAFALALGLFALAALAVLFWPVRGLFWRLLPRLYSSERVTVEDALKHFYDAEYRGVNASLHSLAGALEISGDRAAKLLGKLEERGLVEGSGGVPRLTDRGRREALQVLRIHRLWERYLSDETGLPPTEWHARADAREHRTAPEMADALARRMGEPRYDPHGDPIPTKHGEIAPAEGVPLGEFAVGEVGEIIHVEDEPESIYAELVAEGLSPGMRVRILETSPRKIRFATGSDEHVLAPVVAANLTVRRLEIRPEEVGPFDSLADLELGESGRIVRLSARCRGSERRRLLDLGLIPGTVVAAELCGAGGDPIAYRVRGALLALRRRQASLLYIDRNLDRITDRTVGEGSAS